MAPATRSDPAPVLPRDARLVALILAAAGAEDCEEGVVRMLVEFAHRYTSDILSDSLMYAEHARAGASSSAALTPSLDDIRLAVQARTEGAQVPKEFLLQLATTVNSVPLPPVPEVYGIRLPPPAQRLTAPNFTLVPRSAAPPPHEQQLPPAAPNADLGGAILGTGSLADFGLEGAFDLPGLGGADLGGGSSGMGGTEGGSGAEPGTAEGSESGGGLFGDDDDEDEDDEEMEDVTNGVPGTNGAGGGVKRKAEDDEEYD
ncbi:hypothetical protein Rhopal_002906-T1 [Rhodotorula paludigena]|uniref:Transcription initiation factor TFIID subunit 9 n=1 Tax=Rhodotorula paludigena TaxID=86838 RepID=A0AAV5GLK0_9BASI|nr:hypothetical protein Rhopal_002906-T1 [Rhodotorula paludigena]